MASEGFGPLLKLINLPSPVNTDVHRTTDYLWPSGLEKD